MLGAIARLEPRAFCRSANSRTHSFNLLVSCSFTLVEPFGSAVASAFSSDFSEDLGDRTVRYRGGVKAFFEVAQVYELGEI